MDNASEKRRYYRHPVEFPIQVIEIEGTQSRWSHTKNVSLGGICFLSEKTLERGSRIEVTIPVRDRLFKIKAVVAYSEKDITTGQFNTGVSFQDSKSLFRAKLAEEILCMQQYAAKKSQETGKAMTETETGREWVEQNAKRFAELFQN